MIIKGNFWNLHCRYNTVAAFKRCCLPKQCTQILRKSIFYERETRQKRRRDKKKKQTAIMESSWKIFIGPLVETEVSKIKSYTRKMISA